jgi:hypothetical protein
VAGRNRRPEATSGAVSCFQVAINLPTPSEVDGTNPAGRIGVDLIQESSQFVYQS